MDLMNDENADENALQFPTYLLKVGEDNFSDAVDSRIKLPVYVKIDSQRSKVYEEVFKDIHLHYTDEEWLNSRCILTTKNSNLRIIKHLVGSMIPAEAKHFLSSDKVESDEESEGQPPIYPVDMFSTFTGGSKLLDHDLILKTGYMVMLLRNVDPKSGHYNGSRYILLKMTNSL